MAGDLISWKKKSSPWRRGEDKAKKLINKCMTFPREEASKKKALIRKEETLEWEDLPTEVWCRMQSTIEVVKRFDIAKILELATREDKTVKARSCVDLLREEQSLV